MQDEKVPASETAEPPAQEFRAPEIVRLGKIVDITLGDGNHMTEPPNKWSDRDN